MAEVTALRNNALPYPVYGVPYGVIFPLLDEDGDLVTGGGSDTPDSEVSLNGDTFADCTNELTEIATASGMYYLLLTAAEMTADVVSVICKVATATTQTTPLVLYPRKLSQIRTGTAQAGAVNTITLDATAIAVNDSYNGCLIYLNGGTGSGQARIITAYGGSTKIAAVTPNWATTPDATSTFIIYQPEGRWVVEANVKALDDDAAAANSLESMLDGTGAVLTLSQLRVNSAAAGGAVDIDNSGGPAISAAGTSAGIYAAATAGHGMNLVGGGATGDGFRATGNSAGYGVNGVGGDTGSGIRGLGGSTSGHGAAFGADTEGDGIVATAAGAGVDIRGDITGDLTGTVQTVTTLTGHTAQTGDSFARIGATGTGLTSLAQASVCTNVRLAELDAANLPANLDAALADTAELQVKFAGLADASVPKLDDLLDGTGAVLYLSQLRVNSAAAGGAVDIDNSAGPAISATGSSHGALITGSAGHGVYCLAAGAGGTGLRVQGETTGSGLVALGGTSGHGFYAYGGLTSGDGIHAEAQTDGDGMDCTGTGTGVDIRGDLTGNVTGNLSGSVGSLTGHTVQTGDNFARIGATGSGLTSLAQASVCTNVRLAELDAANLPATTDSILADTAEIGAAGAGLTAVPWNAAWAAQINAEMVDALTVDTHAEPTSVPGATVSIVSMLHWMFSLSRNKQQRTAALAALRNDGNTANIGTAVISDLDNTTTRGKWS